MSRQRRLTRSEGFDLTTSIRNFKDNFGIKADYFVVPEPLSDDELKRVFRKYYLRRKRKEKLGEPTFANFRIFIKVLAREFLLLHYNIIFFEKQFEENRKTFFNLIARLGLINSKPAIHALSDQSRALDISKKLTM